MSTHSMMITCANGECGEEFYMDMEHYTREDLIKVAQETVCPKCGSEKWWMGDGCER